MDLKNWIGIWLLEHRFEKLNMNIFIEAIFKNPYSKNKNHVNWIEIFLLDWVFQNRIDKYYLYSRIDFIKVRAIKIFLYSRRSNKYFQYDTHWIGFWITHHVAIEINYVLYGIGKPYSIQ